MEIGEKVGSAVNEVENGGESERAEEKDIARLAGTTDGDGVEKEQASDAYSEEDELREINEICGADLSALEELPNHERYLKLRASGLLSVKEALYAVNSGKLPRRSEKGGTCEVGTYDVGTERDDTRGHLSSVRNKESGGEVFTRAEREELALWGIESTGAELERLWRRAGMRNG